MTNQSQDQVLVNGTPLPEEQLADLEGRYGARPLPGEYWYDPLSGLYGVAGQPAMGFMHPGHALGSLARDASAGDTGVIVNARELPRAEWVLWSQILRAPILPGSYWLDPYGNAGYEGNPMPVVNLIMAAQSGAAGGAAGGGDNIWATRFGAGNFDSGGQRGYVSVPGHGPIGYGF